jgi:hypothetical protein
VLAWENFFLDGFRKRFWHIATKGGSNFAFDRRFFGLVAFSGAAPVRDWQKVALYILEYL